MQISCRKITFNQKARAKKKQNKNHSNLSSFGMMSYNNVTALSRLQWHTNSFFNRLLNIIFPVRIFQCNKFDLLFGRSIDLMNFIFYFYFYFGRKPKHWCEGVRRFQHYNFQMYSSYRYWHSSCDFSFSSIYFILNGNILLIFNIDILMLCLANVRFLSAKCKHTHTQSPDWLIWLSMAVCCLSLFMLSIVYNLWIYKNV